jgi:poly(3-hydroxybutyrate) depolymerase
MNSACLTGVASLLLASLAWAAAPTHEKAHRALDGWIDQRWERTPVEPLLEVLREAQLDLAEVETRLRAGKLSPSEPPQPRGKLTRDLPLKLEHLDHQTRYLIYVPRAYSAQKQWPLVIVGHGGSSARDLAFGEAAAMKGLQPHWIEAAEKFGLIVLAPLTDRGWGAIGNSILFSAISKVTREYRVDPDRLYLTGHSMGGHLSWRSGMLLADRWGAVAPMSGGYDYVKDKQVWLLVNVPGFATWGTTEPYQIDEFNRLIRDHMVAHRYDWVNHEREGGHAIFPDQVPLVAQFFLDRPRNLYRQAVFARGGGAMEFATPEKNAEWKQEHTWTAGRPIPASLFHWVRLLPLPPSTPTEKDTQEVWAVNKGGNVLELTSRNVRKVRLYLHPRMVDFKKPVVVMANGKQVFKKKVAANLKTLLELVRETDDRGRIFHAAIEVAIADDADVPAPSLPSPRGVVSDPP